ncbi:MAG: Rpn family recombination-promoting nuclease/putative transposase, partial [Saprospiraceae bacterium]|nr:Rpn family recombination-promoting nuclease/putative transposase [Saprospiraceae bacterium]
MNKKAYPYDKFFKSVLTLRRAAEELLVYSLPHSILTHMQLTSLKPVKDSFLDDRLREHFADVVYSCST